jgi:hypothetical protein
MKYQRTVLWIALGAGLAMTRPAAAADPSASTALPKGKPEIHWFAPARPAEINRDLRPTEGLSRRAWTTAVGWHPAASDFPAPETHSPRMDLFWIGHEPWQHVTHSIDDQ